MKIIMHKGDFYSVENIKEFKVLKNCEFGLEINRKQDLYDFVSKVITESRYLLKISTKDKLVVRSFLMKVTGLKIDQLKRLLKKRKRGVSLVTNYENCNKWKKKYQATDILKLVETDNLHNRKNGKATSHNLWREFNLYGKEDFKTIAEISPSHIYNLRNNSNTYAKENLTFTKTNPVQRNIGIRKKPKNLGIPGYLRIDSVHQGDKDKEKGVYYINLVDEVSQWEYIGCVEGISEYFLLPLLLDLIERFPFKIINFHSDNGSEYINHQVADLLVKLAVTQTKSRSRHSNDNALVESKNNSVIRNTFGYSHIPKSEAYKINEFLRNAFDDYLNYHRVCAFPTISVNEKGKETKKYKEYKTPFEKLASLQGWEKYLKPGFKASDLFANQMKMSDNESARLVRDCKNKLLIEIIERRAV